MISLRGSYNGSSPLTRGKLDRVHALRVRNLAHPRSRGENRLSLTQTGIRRGSSPLTRGKQGATLASELQRRLIPAHAGKT